MLKHLASFFLLSGLLLLVVFFASPSLGLDHFYFCVGGVGFILLSFLLNKLGGRKSSKPSRFQTLRKVLGEKESEENER